MTSVTFPLRSFLVLSLTAPGAWGRQEDPSDESPTGLIPLRDYGGELGERAFLLGELGGRRADLAERGISCNAWWTQTFQSIVDGGRREDEAYGGKFETTWLVDLDRMGLVPGGLVSIRTESRYGESVNGDAGTLLPVNDVMYFPLTDLDEDLLLAVTELKYTQFLSPELGVFAGKLVTLGTDYNEFAGGRGDTQFLTHTFLGASVTALANPYSALGTGVFWSPDPDLTVAGTLYTIEDASTTSGFDELDEGLDATLTVRTQHELGGRPGGQQSMFQYSFDGNFLDLSGQLIDQGQLAIPKESDSWVAGLNLWQYLSVEDAAHARVDVTNGRTDLEGLGFFARLATSDADTNPIGFVASGGLGGRGAFEGRERDTWGVGFGYGDMRANLFTSAAPIDESAHRFEAYYSFALTPALELTLDYQVADPLLSAPDTAHIVGLRLRTAF
jgi:porin